jgi:hypothetical protein
MIYKKIISLLSVLAVVAAAFMIPGRVAAGGVASDVKGEAAAEKSVEETLVVMERYGHLLIRPDSGNLTRLKMRPGAVITRNGKPAKLGDIRAGDKVRANYDSNNYVSELHATGT